MAKRNSFLSLITFSIAICILIFFHTANAADKPSLTVLGPISDYNHMIVITHDGATSSDSKESNKGIDLNLATGEIAVLKPSSAEPDKIIKKCTSNDILKKVQPILKDQQLCIKHDYRDDPCISFATAGNPIFAKIDADGDNVKQIAIGGSINPSDQVGKFECYTTYQICDNKADTDLQEFVSSWSKAGTNNPPNLSNWHCEDVPDTQVDPNLIGNCGAEIESDVGVWQPNITIQQCVAFCRLNLKQHKLKSIDCDWTSKDGKNVKFRKSTGWD